MGIAKLTKLSLVLAIFLYTKAKATKEGTSFVRTEDSCTTSKPFYIINKSPKATKPYLTANVKTGGVSGGEETGEANQQWMWRKCPEMTNLVNAATGGCLTKKRKRLVVSTTCKSKNNWSYNSKDGTLQEIDTHTWARINIKKSTVSIATKVLYRKGTQNPWSVFQWRLPETKPTTP